MITRRTQAVLALFGVFLLGGICGALGFGVFVRNEVRQAQQLRERDGFQEFFADRLRLTEEQRDSLDDELARTYDDFAMLRAAVAEEYGELLDTLDRRIAPRLTPEQRERLRAAENRIRHGFPHRRNRMGFAAPPSTTRPDTPVTAPPPIAEPLRSTQKKLATPPAVARVDSLAARSDTVLVRGPGEGLGKLPQNLRRQLGLSDSQFVSVRQVVMETKRQLRADVTELSGYPRLQIGAAVRRVTEMEQRFASILTTEQMAAFAPIRDQLIERMKSEIWSHRGMPRHGRGGPGGPGKGMQRRGPRVPDNQPPELNQ